MDDSTQDDSSNQATRVERLLEHLAAGSYLPNQAIIRLGEDASFWREGQEPTIYQLGVFLHEYVHYLHNYSTIAGIYGFIAHLRVMRLFLNTVDVDGRSHGDAVLDSSAQLEYRQLIEWIAHLTGDSIAPYDKNAHRRDVQFSFINAQDGETSIQLSEQKMTVPTATARFEVTSSTATPSIVDVRLGSHVLMEGIAWEVEQMVYAGQNVDLSQVAPLVFPYRICRLVFEGITGHQPSSTVMAKAILLALQTTDPGYYFVRVANAFRHGLPRESDLSILARLEKEMERVITAMGDDLCNRALDLEFSGFGSRGHAGRGLQTMTQWCKEYVRLRSKDPFFEIDALSNGVTPASLRALLESHPPCPVVQSLGFGTDEIEMLTFSSSPVDPQEMGAAQGLLQFASGHLARQHIVTTANAKKGPCRFFGACKAPFSQSSPDVCKSQPWLSFDPEQRHGCWYSQGVLAARSRTDLPGASASATG